MSGKVVVITNQKGGSGKTTLSYNIAVAATGTKLRPVCLVDTDPQGSMTQGFNKRAREEPALAEIDITRPGEHLKRLKAHFGLVVVDTPPAASPFIAGLIRLADLVLVPVRATAYDFGAVNRTIELCETEAKPFVFVLNAVRPRARAEFEARVELGAAGRVAPVTVHLYEAFEASAASGVGVTELHPSGKAALEIRYLTEYLEAVLKKQRIAA
jgi:chromosome partitioning protein